MKNLQYCHNGLYYSYSVNFGVTTLYKLEIIMLINTLSTLIYNFELNNYYFKLYRQLSKCKR